MVIHQISPIPFAVDVDTASESEIFHFFFICLGITDLVGILVLDNLKASGRSILTDCGSDFSYDDFNQFVVESCTADTFDIKEAFIRRICIVIGVDVFPIPDVVGPVGDNCRAGLADLAVLALMAFGIVLIDRCALCLVLYFLATVDGADVPVIMGIIG